MKTVLMIKLTKRLINNNIIDTSKKQQLFRLLKNSANPKIVEKKK